MQQLAPNIQYIFNFIIIIINVLFYLFVVWRIEYTKKLLKHFYSNHLNIIKCKPVYFF